jgi:hypothetical protein
MYLQYDWKFPKNTPQKNPKLALKNPKKSKKLAKSKKKNQKKKNQCYSFTQNDWKFQSVTLLEIL